MPIRSDLVGSTGEPQSVAVDARWLMAYAAGLGDAAPCYLDTLQGIVGHPLFAVCYEWPVLLATRKRQDRLSMEEAVRGVHASHALRIHRLVRPGDRLTCTATLAGVRPTAAGAYEVIRLDTRDAQGKPVCTTWYGTLFRGVSLEGEERWIEGGRPPEIEEPRGEGQKPAEIPVQIPANAAHVYTECARIWNPIHTDLAVARAAGLPGLILHGTATLALAVSLIVHHNAGGDPARVRLIGGKFKAMVLLGTKITVRVLAHSAVEDGTAVHFEVLTHEGKPAVSEGVVVVG